MSCRVGPTTWLCEVKGSLWAPEISGLKVEWFEISGESVCSNVLYVCTVVLYVIMKSVQYRMGCVQS